MKNRDDIAYFHLPGLFEFYELYRLFLPLFRDHREYFYDWCEIGSIYGAPADCLWGGGRVGYGDASARDVLDLLSEYGISARLTFSNSLVAKNHLADLKCNKLCKLFDTPPGARPATPGNLDCATNSDNLCKPQPRNGVIVHSDLLLEYVREHYPELYLVSSTTKVLTNFDDLTAELNREEFAYVVPDFRLNKAFDRLAGLTKEQKAKVEFLCNECCDFGCTERKACYENVSRLSLGEDCPEHVCRSLSAGEGYRFSRAMENPAFIGIEDIRDTYLPLGFTNFKIEGRSLGSAVVLEFLLYYLTRPEYQLKVRESIYLDSMLDLF